MADRDSKNMERLGANMIKMVCTDVDGTLVKDGTSQLNPEYFVQIERLLKKGIRFVVASGRPFSSIKNMFEPILDKIDIIFDNGAGIMTEGKMLELRSIDRSLAMEIIREIEAFPECHTYVSARKIGYVDKNAENLYQWLVEGYRIEMQFIEKMPDDLPEDDILCIEMYHPKNAEQVAKQGFYQKWSEGYGLVLNAAGKEWMHINRADADKGSALSLLKEHFGIVSEEVMVFGDNMNDIGMLQQAVHSYAIGNAREEVKRAAAFVADTNVNDGVLKVLCTI